MKLLADRNVAPRESNDSRSASEDEPGAPAVGSLGWDPRGAREDEWNSNERDRQFPGTRAKTAEEWSVPGLDATQSGQVAHDPFDPEIFNRRHLRRDNAAP